MLDISLALRAVRAKIVSDWSVRMLERFEQHQLWFGGERTSAMGPCALVDIKKTNVRGEDSPG